MTESYSIVPPDERAANPGDAASTPAGETIAVAREQADQLKDTAAEAGAHVVESAKDEAANVADEAKRQAKSLLSQAQTELRDQAAAQQQRAASGLRSLSEQLRDMADSSDASGIATNLVRDASSRAGTAASWLDGRDPGSLLDEVKSFARSRPGVFIAGAAIAGILAGRLTRSVAEVSRDESSESPAAQSQESPSAEAEVENRTVEPVVGTPLYSSLASEHEVDPATLTGSGEPRATEENW